MSTATAAPTQRRTLSCAECRRRRIRCDANAMPCNQCSYYLVPHLCHYPTRKKRLVPSAKAYSELSNAYDDSLKILRTLFPTLSLDELKAMSRSKLLQLANGNKAGEYGSSPHESIDSTTSNVVAEELRVLETPSSCQLGWDEMSDDESQGPRVEDDVNGLSLTDDTPRSYTGMSSVSTMLRVIISSSTQAQQALKEKRKQHSNNSQNQANSPTQGMKAPEPLFPDKEEDLIDAYFTHVHIVTPMVDEVSFREITSKDPEQLKNNGPWLALYNMVLALGHVASSCGNQVGHKVYYQRATKHLGFSSLGSGQLFTVQALTLLGGYYLHFVHRPNMANTVMGAALRMALALGLHRVSEVDPQSSPEQQRAIETRKRTWWSLFCLDIWAGTTLNRPGFGPPDPTTVTTLSSALCTPLDYAGISIRSSEEFCKIAARIQNRLAQDTLMTSSEIHQADLELKSWRNSLHPFFKELSRCPEVLRTSCGLLRCRFFTLRLTIYRPYLLSSALKKRRGHAVFDEEKEMADKCTKIAMKTVDIIAQDWMPNQISAWNSVWHMFQAGLVLVLSTIVGSDEKELNPKVHLTLDLLHQMKAWTHGAERSFEVIKFLFESSQADTSSERVHPDSLLSDCVFLDLLDTEWMGAGTEWMADPEGFVSFNAGEAMQFVPEYVVPM